MDEGRKFSKKPTGVHLNPETKREMEEIADELSITPSSLGRTLFLEFIDQYKQLKGKGKIAWPIKFHLAYYPDPKLEFQGKEGAELPKVAESQTDTTIQQKPGTKQKAGYIPPKKSQRGQRR